MSSIDPPNQPYSSNLCFHLPAFQSPKNPIIHPFTKLSIQSAILPTSISLSIHLSTKSPIHPFIRRAIFSSIDSTNQLHSSNLQTHHPSFQPPKHLIIHSSTKLSIQFFIYPSGINLSIHLNNRRATHLFIHPKSFRLINHPSMQSAIHLSKLLLPAILSPKN